MTYRLTGKAEDDFISIYVTGVRDFGVAQAERYQRDLIETFETLSDNPRLARARQELRPPMRVHPHGSHLILYRIEENGDILIVRIRHAREDWIPDPQG